MSSIAQKLQTFREGQKKTDTQVELQQIKGLSLEQLSAEKISFGKAKLGQEFPKAFNDHAWTDWFVQTYEKSTKPSHQMYIQYVEKRLNAEIKQELKGTSSKTNMKDTPKPVEDEPVGPDLRDGCDPRFRDARNGKADPSGGSSDQPHDAEPELGQPHDADRDVHAGVAASCPKSERQERNVGSAPEKSHQDSNRHDMDYEYQHDGPNNHYLSHVKKLVRKFEQELQHVAHQVESYGQNRGPRLDLLEVMCSAESELTSQIRKLGGRAEAFWQGSR